MTALYSRLLLSCRVGLHVGGGGLSGGEGDYITTVQNICLVMQGNPQMNYKEAEGGIWKLKFQKCKIESFLTALIYFFFFFFFVIFQEQLVGTHKPACVGLCTLERNRVN